MFLKTVGSPQILVVKSWTLFANLKGRIYDRKRNCEKELEAEIFSVSIAVEQVDYVVNIKWDEIQ